MSTLRASRRGKIFHYKNFFEKLKFFSRNPFDYVIKRRAMMSANIKRINDGGLKDVVTELPHIDGTVTQRYRLLSKIGSGGMGDVFLGIQRGAVDFQRLIVLKRIHSHLLDMQSQSQMFVDEASLVASLNHPNIVKIIDFRRAENTFYIVMEYVDGETLKTIRSICHRKGIIIPFALAVKFILASCDALHYAHNATSRSGAPLNIIHRDIGLHNLMIDRNGYLKVIDFGIAKSNIQTDLTSPELIKGNPSYMAPDIFVCEDIDSRVDIYALGLSLFELLTAQRAFKFDKSVPLAHVFQKITNMELPAPSSLVPSVPKELDTIVKKATAKDRKSRYQTVASLALDLQEVARKYVGEFEAMNPRQWFYDHFSDRITERIRFEQKLLDLATTTSATGISSYLPPPTAVSLNDVSSARRSTFQKFKGNIVERKRLAIGVLAVVLLSLGSWAIYAFVGESPAPVEARGVTAEEDNLSIHTAPAGAMIYVDGKHIGMTTEKGGEYRLEPGKEHTVTITKAGFADHTATVVVAKNGYRSIDVTLVPIEDASAAGAAPVPSNAPDSDRIQLKDPVETQRGSSAASRWKRVVKRNKRSASSSDDTPSEDPYVDNSSKPSPQTSPEKSSSLPPATSKPKTKTAVPLLDEPKKTHVPLLDSKKSSDVPLL